MLNLFYLLVYWAKGHLPWFGYIKKNERSMNKYELVKRVNDLKMLSKVE